MSDPAKVNIPRWQWGPTESLWLYPDDHPEHGVQTEAERAVCARLRASTTNEDAWAEMVADAPAWGARQKRIREAGR